MIRPYRYTCLLFCLAFLTRTAGLAHGHGTPIHVELSENRLVATTGLSDSAGFAPTLIYEDDDDSEPFATTGLPGFGEATIWQLPGYDIFGLEENSGFFLEPIARPDFGADPTVDRVLWFWNPETELVEPADSTVRLQIRKTPTVHTTLAAASSVAPPPLQLAAPVSADMGFHNHLVLYALDAAAPAGAYGFFARLTSNVYEPTEPILFVFNHGVFDYEQMTAATLAINLAAVLPGDFNDDGRVDAADYTVWRDGLGGAYTAEDYEVWRSHFGQPNAGGSGGGAKDVSPTAAVPEPASLVLAGGGAAVFLLIVCARSGRMEWFVSAG
jgi:hypothetical protein